MIGGGAAARCPRILPRATFSLQRVFQCLADEALIWNPRPGRGSPHRIEQWPRQAHIYPLAFGLKLETDRPHAGKVVFGQVGLLDKVLGFLIAFEPWQFLFQCSTSFLCVKRALIGRWLALDADGGFHLRAEKSAADADEAVGRLGDEETLTAVAAARARA